jgi:hypothetical protein
MHRGRNSHCELQCRRGQSTILPEVHACSHLINTIVRVQCTQFYDEDSENLEAFPHVRVRSSE